MENIIGLKELRENMGSFISQVSKGKSFVVVRRSKPIFKLAPVDEWGDEGVWESVLDLTKGKEKGISVQELIARIRKFDAKQDRKVSKNA